MIVALAPRPPASVRNMADLDPDQIFSPSRDQLGAETDQLLDRISQLGHDLGDSYDDTVSQELRGRWNTYVNEVHEWDSGPRWLNHLLGTTWRDELIVYQRRFNDFVSEFQGSGVPTGNAKFTFSAAPPGVLDKIGDKVIDAGEKAIKPVTDLATTLKWVAIVGGAVAVGFVFYLTYETGKTARALGTDALRL